MSTTTAGRSDDFRILGVIGVGHGMSHIYYLALPPLFVHLRDTFNVTYAELGMALAVMSLASAVLQVPIGFMVDRLGARVMLLSGFAVVSTAITLMGFCTSFWQLLALCFVAGAGNAVFHPTDYAILNSSISQDRMGRAFSLHTFSGQVGSAAAPVIMIALAQLSGWREALITIGLVGFVAMAIVMSQWNVLRDDVFEKKPPPEKKSDQALPSASSPLAVVFAPPMLMFFVFFTVLSMMQTGMQAFIATALVAQHGTPLTIANLALSAYLFSSAAGVLLGGEISDRWRRHDLVATLVFVVSGLCVLLMAWFSFGAAILVLLMIVIGIGQGATRPARDMMLRAATPKRQTGGVFGFVTSGIAVGSALAPIPLGWFLDIGKPAWIFYLLALFMVLALVSMMAQRALTR